MPFLWINFPNGELNAKAITLTIPQPPGRGEGLEMRLISEDWTSLVAEWIETRLSMQGTWDPSLVPEDSTCCGTTKLIRHKYWARGPEGRVALAHRNWRKPEHSHEDPAQPKINKYSLKKKITDEFIKHAISYAKRMAHPSSRRTEVPVIGLCQPCPVNLFLWSPVYNFYNKWVSASLRSVSLIAN